MKSRDIVFLFTALIVMILLTVPMVTTCAFSSGASPGTSGAPGEGTCGQCHQNGPDDGSLTIQGVPAEYDFQQTYSITVSLEDPGQARWGFQLTAIDGANLAAGTITVTEPGATSKSTGGGKDYLNHTVSGTYAGTPDGPVTWSFDWTAPASDMGPISFYAAGNAANNDLGTGGDNIYTTDATTNPAAMTTPTPTATPDMQPTATPTGTGPTPTPGACIVTGVTLDMPGDMFSPGDLFYLNARFCNATADDLIQHPLFILLEVFGEYFAAPSWQSLNAGLDNYTQDFPVGETTIVVLPEFNWPSGAGSASGIVLIGALTDPAITTLIGEADTITFGWME